MEVPTTFADDLFIDSTTLTTDRLTDRSRAKTMTTTTNTNELTDRQIQLGEMLAALGYEGSWWCPRDQQIQLSGRVYLNTTRRDAKVWISFENPAECTGPKLNIKVTSEYQPKAWCYAEEEKVDRKFRNADAAAHRFADGETDISDLI